MKVTKVVAFVMGITILLSPFAARAGDMNSGVSAFPVACCGVSERIRLCSYLENQDSLRFSGTAGSFNPAKDMPSTGRAQDDSLTELNKNLSNPVSEIWSLNFEQNNYLVDTDSSGDNSWSPDLNFEPFMPASLTGNWNLITMPVLPLFVTQLYTGLQAGSSSGTGIKTSTGFGDITLTEMLAPTPKLAGNWLLGFGPTFIFPTASTDFIGQGKWQIGPAAVLGYLSKNWLLGVFVRNWTSFARRHKQAGHELNES